MYKRISIDIVHLLWGFKKIFFFTGQNNSTINDVYILNYNRFHFKRANVSADDKDNIWEKEHVLFFDSQKYFYIFWKQKLKFLILLLSELDPEWLIEIKML